MALHLRAQHQLGLQLGNARFDFEVVVADERLHAIQLGRVAHFAGKFAAVGADADHGKAHFLAGHLGRSHGVGGVAKHKHAFAGEVSGVHRAGVPGGARVGLGQRRFSVQACQRGDFADESAGSTRANRNGFGEGLAKGALQPLRRQVGDLGVEHDIEVGVGQAAQVFGCGGERRHHVDLDAHVGQQSANLLQVVTVPKAQRRGAQDIATWLFRLSVFTRWRCGLGQVAHELVKGLGGAPVFLALVGGKFEGHHGHGQVQSFAQAARVVLDQLSRARGAHQHGLGLEALKGFARCGLEQLGRVAAQVARLEGGVGHRRALLQALDHGEQQVRIGIALGRVQHVMHFFHGRGHPHGADMGRAFIGPEGELHGGRY